VQERATDEFAATSSGAAEDVHVLRALCLMYLDGGMPAGQVAHVLGRSRQWVYRIKHAGTASVYDRRRRTDPQLLDEAVRLREELGCGAAQAAALLRSRGLDAPSVTTIAAEFRRRHLASSRAVFAKGPPVVRTPLTHHGEELGLDIWGPWVVWGAGRMLAVTGMDSFSRVAGGVLWRQLDPEAYSRSLAYLVDRLYGNRWPARLLISHRLESALAPLDGQLAPLIRLALAHGTTPVYLPAGQPWKNTRLQRFHTTQEREFWRLLSGAMSEHEIRQHYREWLDYYNTEREHAAIYPKSPARLAGGWYRRFAARPELPQVATVAPQPGRIEYWRCVQASGWIALDDDILCMPGHLVGQQVVVTLQICPGQTGSGEILWQPAGQREPIWVATLAHDYDGALAPWRTPIRMVRRNPEVYAATGNRPLPQDHGPSLDAPEFLRPY
jgi:hypothetical protein